MNGNHLVTRNGTYYFRLRLPYDISPYFEKKEIWKSLKTKDYKIAKVSILKLLYSTEQLFLHLRSGMYSETEIRKLVKKYLHEYLDRCEGIRSLGIVRYESKRHEEHAPEAIVAESIKAIDELIASSKLKLMMNDFTEISARVGWYIKGKGLQFEEGSIEYTSFCREILKAEIEALKIEKQRMSGDYDNRYDNFLKNTITSDLVDHQKISECKTEGQSVVLLSQVIQENIKEAELGGNWNEKTKAENESIYKIILEIVGDVDIKNITHQTMMQFRNDLSKLPPNREKKPEYKDKSVNQILKMKNVPTMSRTTLNKYLVRASTLFKWATKHGYIQTNVAEGLTLPKTRRAEQEREAYSTADIHKIFEHIKFDAQNPHTFWIPLIGMYQGMRLDEICQLYIDDIIDFEGVPCISINKKLDKKLKNIASERVIPIHPMLITLGFLKYVNALRQKNMTRLWGKLVEKRDGYSQDFGKWYQRFNRKYVTDNPKRVFHSFRHSLADRLKQAGVQETLIAEILGHSIESVTMGRYGKRYQPKVLLDALAKLDYQIKLPQ